MAVLKKLKEKDIIEYIAKNNDATIVFNEVREDEKTINRVSKYLEAQNQLKTHQLKSVLYYIKEKNTCKSKLLLRYFGEIKEEDCRVCSYCIAKAVPKKSTKSISEKIIGLLKIQELNSRDIQKMTKLPKDDIIFALQDLLEKDIVYVKPNNLYSLK